MVGATRTAIALALVIGLPWPVWASDVIEGPAEPVTVVAVIDFGFSPYHYDFVGHQHPWNLDDDAGNDFDFRTDPATYIPGYPADAIPIELTVPTEHDEVVADRRDGVDADAWDAFEISSSPDDVTLHWFPGTKIIGAVSFGRDFYDTNDAHGTRSAASAAGNLHGTCPECLFVLVTEPVPAALEWVAAQP